MQETQIEWTNMTWNPATGCTKVGPGCDNCYAATFAERFRGVKGKTMLKPTTSIGSTEHSPDLGPT